MNSKVFWRLNEAYQLGVCNQIEEETLTEEELLGLQEWVEALIEEGYNLDEYSDDELYEAYLQNLDEGYKKLPVGKMMKKVFRKGYARGSSGYMDRSGGKYAYKRSAKMFDAAQEHDPEASQEKERQNRIRGRQRNEDLDLYDLVSEYLVSEGFCDSYEDADVIMVNMSEEWRENILDEAGRMTGANDQQASWYAQKYGNNSKPRSDSEISKEPGGKEFLARLKKAKEKSKK
jgi:hypothetical protein